MADNKLVQKAGDGSQQVQAGTVIINNGITEERCRAIYSELSEKALADQTAEGTAIAEQRIQKLEEKLLPRIQSLENDFSSFSDPSFQILIKKAQITAGCSDRELDYGLLTELIAHRINNKGNIKKKASIEKAVEIIDKIDNDALCGLTLFHAMNRFSPVSGIIDDGLRVIDDLYSKCQYMDLPTGQDWLDNLEILGAIRINQISSFNKFEDCLANSWDGYACIGIAKDSPDYTDCCAKLKSVQISEGILIKNTLLEGYVRLPVLSRTAIDKLAYTVPMTIHNLSIPIPLKIELSPEQKEVLYQIYDKYSNDAHLLEQAKKRFKDILISHKHINTACQWWGQIKTSFNVTSIGSAIAQANAKRIDNNLPDID